MSIAAFQKFEDNLFISMILSIDTDEREVVGDVLIHEMIIT